MEHRLRNGQHREEPLVQVRRTAQRRQLLFQGQQLDGRQDRGVQAERHLALRQGTFAAEPDGRRSDAHLQATRHHGDARQPLSRTTIPPFRWARRRWRSAGKAKA